MNTYLPGSLSINPPIPDIALSNTQVVTPSKLCPCDPFTNRVCMGCSKYGWCTSQVALPFPIQKFKNLFTVVSPTRSPGRRPPSWRGLDDLASKQQGALRGRRRCKSSVHSYPTLPLSLAYGWSSGLSLRQARELINMQSAWRQSTKVIVSSSTHIPLARGNRVLPNVCTRGTRHREHPDGPCDGKVQCNRQYRSTQCYAKSSSPPPKLDFN